MANELVRFSAAVDIVETEASRMSRRLFDTVAALLADNLRAASTAGTIWEAGGYRYAEAASSATDHHVTTAGGVKLYVLPQANKYYVDAFGAVGDGVADDAAIINSAASAVRSAGASYGLFFSKPLYRSNSSLDLTEIRIIDMVGEIRSGVTDGVGVTIGTTINANSAMENGKIKMFVRNVAANNSGLAGSVGIRIRGAARCDFRLYSYTWDTAIEIAPDGATGIQYVAFNTFIIGTNVSKTGLKFNGNFTGGNGWINENTFLKVDAYPQSNQISGDTVGVHMAGSYSSNKNIFLDLSVEGQDTPIWIERGLGNRFYNARLESAGPVRFGAVAAASDKSVSDNTVHAAYGSPPPSAINVEWYATRPNYVAFSDIGVAWATVLTMDYHDFFKVGSSVYSKKWLNTVSGTTLHTFATLDDALRSVDVGSNHSAYVDVPCSAGDVFRVKFDFDASSAGRSLSFDALDANKTILSSLEAGQTPYIGSDVTPATSALSGTSATFSHNNAAFANPFHMSINRSEVHFVRVRLRSGVKMQSLLMERLVRGELKSLAGNYPASQKTIATSSVSPDFPGQLAFLSPTLPLMAMSATMWAQIGNAYQATATDIADVAAAVNTSNKFLGLVVWDTTNNRSLRARGPGAADAWDVVDGSASVVPS